MNAVAAFEGERARLTRLAYRMLGSVAEAQDVVQDAWLRWDRAVPATIINPAAWLTRAVTRLCLDRLRADRARREAYVGPWLPEPFIEEVGDPVLRAEDVSVAFLLALQRLSPLERAAFLLHDVFDADYAAIARALDRGEVACRRLVSRARTHIKDAKPRFVVPADQAARLIGAFLAAAASNDASGMAALLAEDCVLISDGGGKRPAALRPIVGREEVMRLIQGLIWRGTWPAIDDARPARINGACGLILRDPGGVQTIAFETCDEGRVAAIYVVRNPEKLRGLELQR